MNQAKLPEISPRYAELLEAERWDDYLDGLCHDGLFWWFNLKIEQLAAHLRPLIRLPESRLTDDRIRLLREAMRLPMSSKCWSEIYHDCLNARDREAAVAAAGGGVAAIWENGNDFQRFIPWYRELNAIESDRMCASKLANAYLVLFKGVIEMEGNGQLIEASESFRRAEALAESARSSSLRLLAAVLRGHCVYHCGDPAQLDLILFDIKPLSKMPDTAPWCSVHYELLSVLNRVVKGDHHGAVNLATEIVERPFFSMLPLSTQLMATGYLLLATILAGDQKRVRALSECIQDVVIPNRNHLNHARVHNALGVAALAQKNAYQALLHGKEALQWARTCGSPLNERCCSLLIGQALCDLLRSDEALAHLSLLLCECQRSNHKLLSVATAVELALLMGRQGKITRARKYMKMAVNRQPSDQQPYVLNRPPCLC